MKWKLGLRLLALIVKANRSGVLMLATGLVLTLAYVVGTVVALDGLVGWQGFVESLRAAWPVAAGLYLGGGLVSVCRTMSGVQSLLRAIGSKRVGEVR